MHMDDTKEKLFVSSFGKLDPLPSPVIQNLALNNGWLLEILLALAGTNPRSLVLNLSYQLILSLHPRHMVRFSLMTIIQDEPFLHYL